MPEHGEKPLSKKIFLQSVFIFIISYLLFLVLWIQVKNYYGNAITFASSKVAAGVKDLNFEEMKEGKDVIEVTFSPVGRDSSMLIDIPIKTSSYTFNAPLTFAIMSALYLFIVRRRRAYGAALLVLLAVHFLYVFSLEAKELTEVLIERGLESASRPRLFFYQFLWGFTNNMLIRFEPFLIGIYVLIRFKG